MVAVARYDLIAMQAFPPMDKGSRDYVRKLASLYGLKYSEQGGKGKKIFVMVSTTSQCPASQVCSNNPYQLLKGSILVSLHLASLCT